MCPQRTWKVQPGPAMVTHTKLGDHNNQNLDGQQQKTATYQVTVKRVTVKVCPGSDSFPCTFVLFHRTPETENAAAEKHLKYKQYHRWLHWRY